MEALEQTVLMEPDVVLMDMTMPRLNGIQATRQISEKFPGIRVLVLSMHGDRELVVESLKAGARGYILKECTSDELYTAIRAVVAGQYYLTPSVLPALIEDYLRLLQVEAKSSALVQRNRHSVRFNTHAIEYSHVGSTGTNTRQLLFKIHRRHLHAVLRIL